MQYEYNIQNHSSLIQDFFEDFYFIESLDAPLKAEIFLAESLSKVLDAINSEQS
jgi:hypothetical protein